MKASLRKSGIDVLGDVPWGTHICQFYFTKEELMDILAPYFKVGLENNEFCLWVISQPFKLEDAKETLRRVIPDLNVYLEKGQIDIISYKDWFFTEGIFDIKRVLNNRIERLNYASLNGYEGFRLFSNTSWLRKEDWNSYLKYMELSDNIIDNYQMISLSTHSLDSYSVDEVIQLSLNHQFTLVKSEGKWKSFESIKRKLDEERIRNLANIVESSSDAIGTISLAGVITSWNKGAEQVYGYSTKDALGKPASILAPLDLRDETYQLSDRVKKGEKIRNFETIRQRKDGKLIYVSFTLSPVFDNHGKLTAVSFISRDISERIRAEEKIRKFANIVESSNDGIGIISLDGIVTGWNKGAEQVYGYSTEEAIGKPVSILAPSDLRNETIRLSERVKKGEKISNFETIRQRKDGKLIHVSFTLSPIFNRNGKLTAVSFISRDISERIKTEEKIRNLANIVESSNDAIGTISLAGIITSWNKGAEQVYGYSTEEAIGKPVSILAPSDLRDETIRLSERIKKGEKITNYETIRQRKDGKRIHVSFTLSPVFDIDKKITAVSFISRDIGERKK
jgi:two-component system, sensor histidine kinase PdtaS